VIAYEIAVGRLGVARAGLLPAIVPALTRTRANADESLQRRAHL
jgi:hypothetical protein